MPKADADTQEATDHGRSDATDTTNNDQDDRALGDDWDDDDTSFDSADDDIEESGDSDSAATDDEEADDSEDGEDVEESTEETETTEDSEDAEDSDSEDESDATDDSPEERKRRNDAAAKARIEAKQAREAEARARAEADQLRREREQQQLQAFLDEAGDDENERNNRALAVKEYELQQREIGMNRQTLQVGIERAVASIDLFRNGTKVQQDELANSLDDFEARYVEKNAQGQPIAIKIDPFTGQPADVVSYLQRKAESISRLAGEGVKKQQKQKSRQSARTQVTPVRAPKKAKVDPMMAGFDEEAGSY